MTDPLVVLFCGLLGFSLSVIIIAITDAPDPFIGIPVGITIAAAYLIGVVHK